ncbi:MarR family transcriptional regulator [Bifidobacterium callitrichidarum]|uniref:HTH marR-type domain-containing protein n=1 Tax=Bifidobacterium callitrichidarum TaxID=2052941 RepID=A0A2U2NCM3_9BIFI|nr:MarR family transcriptional regulator [Bifidobacterium callitrichidarum]PWG66749.1 hypothetical protein DF196_02265 [Bifidobacterium callitrichidarum]
MDTGKTVEYLERELKVPVEQENGGRVLTGIPMFLKIRGPVPVTVGGYKLVFAKGMNGRFDIEKLKRDAGQLTRRTGRPVVFDFEKVSTYQRRTLSEQDVPFVVAGREFRLPFMGVVYADNPLDAPDDIERLTPNEQLVFLYLLYTNRTMQQQELADTLGVPAGYVSRGAKRLELLGLVTRSTKGHRAYLKANVGEGTRAGLLDKAWPMLRTPIMRTDVAVFDGKPDEGLHLAGESALSERTMLGEPYMASYATNRAWVKANRQRLTFYRKDYQIPPGTAFNLETWGYDPEPLIRVYGRDGMADPLSVMLSLRDHPDERIQQAIETNLDDIREEWDTN